MGERRIQEVNMVTLFLTLSGVVFVLAAASRIWTDATPLNRRGIDSASMASIPGDPIALKKITEDKKPVA